MCALHRCAVASLQARQCGICCAAWHEAADIVLQQQCVRNACRAEDMAKLHAPIRAARDCNSSMGK